MLARVLEGAISGSYKDASDTTRPCLLDTVIFTHAKIL